MDVGERESCGERRLKNQARFLEERRRRNTTVLPSIMEIHLKWANMGLSDNPANLNLQNNSEEGREARGVRPPLLFYYLVSL